MTLEQARGMRDTLNDILVWYAPDFVHTSLIPAESNPILVIGRIVEAIRILEEEVLGQ